MSKTQPLILNPTVIHCDELLTIKNSEGKFNDAAYVIQNESGSVIRKGSITISSFTFQLRIDFKMQKMGTAKWVYLYNY